MKILFLGDSITEGGKATCNDNNFVNIVTKTLNVTTYNYGVGGTRIAPQTHTYKNYVECDEDFIKRLDRITEDADMVFVFGGTNDYGHGDAPLGEFDSDDHSTFAGAVKLLTKKLVERYGKEKLCFIIPIPRYMEDSPFGEEGNAKATPSGTLEDYRNIIRKTCEKYNIETLDLVKDFGKITTNKCSDLLEDGLHPNDNGHKLIAEKIISYIKEKENL